MRNRECALQDAGRRILSWAVIACLGMGASTHGEIVDFTAIPTGTCAGTASTATGVGTFSLDTATGDVTFDIQMTGITPNEMHIHAPAAECFFVQFAGVRIVLPTGTDVSGTFNANQELMDWMLDEKSWFVVHTGAQSTIEIIGHLIRQCPNDCSGHGTCVLGACLCEPDWSGDDCSIEQVVPTVSTWGLLAMTLLLLGGATLVMKHRQVA